MLERYVHVPGRCGRTPRHRGNGTAGGSAASSPPLRHTTGADRTGTRAGRQRTPAPTGNAPTGRCLRRQETNTVSGVPALPQSQARTRLISARGRGGMSEEWNAAAPILTAGGDLPDKIRLERATGTGPGRYAVEGHMMTSTGRGAAALPLVVGGGGPPGAAGGAPPPPPAMSPQAVACCCRCMP